MMMSRSAWIGGFLAASLAAAPASATFVGSGAGWVAFCFGGAGSEATDTGCTPQTGIPLGASEFTTIAAGTTTTIEITDAVFAGDVFRITLNNGAETFFSSVPAPMAPTEFDPDAAFLGGLFSRASITLDPGFNSFRIFAEASPFGAGIGYVRVVPESTLDATEVPAPAALGLFGLALAGLLAARRR
jgi:hypothetical protein